jgi:hypothetical protein
MASSYTDIGTELMATGENAGTWGTKTNTNIQILEEAINGYVSQALTSGGTVSLTYTDGSTGDVARHAVIALTGTITGNAVVTVPANEKVWIIDNQSSGAYTVTVKVSGQTGVTWGASDKGTKILYANGTDVVDTSIGGVGAYDLNGGELILDADADTSITADTDDQIDIKIAGADDFQFTANTFTAQSGSTIAAQALTATTVTASGIVKTDDTTEATSTTDGSLQTDGGLSVAKDAVIGDDLKLLSDSAVLSFGADSDTTLTHTDGTGLTLNSTNKLLFRDTGLYINSSTDGQLDIVADTEVQIAATTIDINGAVALNGAITGATNITLSGELDAATGDFSGDVDVDGTLETDALSINSTTITTTAAEINLIDGGTARGTTAVADGDGLLVNDAGTMRMTNVTTLKTYFQEGISTAFDDLTAGDAAVTISTTSGNITIDATANDTDIIFKGTDNNSDITMLTLDGSEAGAATFNNKVVATELDISGDVDIDGTLETDAITLDGSAFIKLAGTNFTGSLLLGHATTGTLDAAQYNTGVGLTALDAITSGDNNTALGYGALTAVTSGGRNVALGVNAMVALTSGQQNVAIGHGAVDNTNASYNVGVGTDALTDATGTSNTAFGHRAGYDISSGDYNITVGYLAGDNITSGSGNVVIGKADVSSATGDDQLSISDGEDGSVAWITGDSSGNLTFAADVTVGDDLNLTTDSSVITFGADSDTTLTHTDGTGLTLNSTNKLCFNDASQFIHAPSATVLDIAATDEIELTATEVEINATSIDINGNTDIQNDLNIGGNTQYTADGVEVKFGANSDVRLIHEHDVGLKLKHTATGDDKPVKLTLQTGETDIAADDVIGAINFQAPDEATGTDAILVAAGIEAVSEGDFSSSSNATKLSFKTGASEAAAEKMSLSSAGVLTVSSTITANSQDVILGKFGGTNFSNSMLIGHATTGTLSTATNNIGIGVTTLDALTSGDKNVAVGVSALTACTEGLRNLAFGNESLEGVTTGDDNVGIGDSAGYYNSTGDLNVAIGKSAMQGASGQSNSHNTAIGGDAFKVITTGGRNIGIGYQAGDNLTSGSGNVIIGSVDAGSATGSRQLLISGNDGSTTTTWISGDNNGVVTLADDLVIKDGGTIGVSSDADAITIASNGAVTFSQTPVFPDGSIAVADLDIDGATDIGEDLVDADLFIVDNGAGGTNRKVAASRVKTYIGGGTSWQAVKTGNFTASAGQGVFVNTTSAAITITLPAGTIGDEVSIVDYAGTFDSNACTIAANGSEKIFGSTDDLTVSTERAAFTLVFTDSTQGWLFKND